MPQTCPAQTSVQEFQSTTAHSSDSASLEAHDKATADDKAAAKKVENNAISALELTGLSVDVAIVVVLSWAAQLVHLQDAAVVIEADRIRFNLGKCCLPSHASIQSRFTSSLHLQMH